MSSMPICDNIQFSNTIEQHRTHRRINGLEKPLHYQQIIIWILLVLFALIDFFILIPTLHVQVQPLMYGVISSLFFIHIVSHIVAVIIDPCDPNLLNVSKDAVVPEFDRSKFSHVIENGYCNLCSIYIINGKTKHCSICNKCIEKFDHHCRWLNHCIGARNYNGFIICIVSALITCIIVLFMCIIELFLYFYNPTYLNLNSWTHSSRWVHVYHNSNSSNSDFDNFLYNTPLNDQIYLCMIFVQCVLTFIITILLLHLCIFHFYISYLGLTTYEYIKKYKSNESSVQNNNVRHSVLTESSNTINNSLYQNSLPVEQNLFVYYLCYFCMYRKDGTAAPQHKITNVNSIELSNQNNVHASVGVGGVSKWTHIKNILRAKRKPVDSLDNNGKVTVETIENTFNQMELQREKMRKQQKINYICKEKFLQKQAKYNNQNNNNKSSTFCFCLKRYYYPNYNKKNIRKVIKSCRGCKYCRSKSNLANESRFTFLFWRKRNLTLTRNVEYPNVRNVQCSPNIRRNQVKPLTPNETAVFIPLKSPSDNEGGELVSSVTGLTTTQQSSSVSGLPSLPPPNRKQLHNVSLKEIGDAILSANRQSNGSKTQRKTSVSQIKSTKEPNLSPIHESGLSNPSTPHMRNQKMKINKQTGQSGLWLSVDSPLARRK